MSKHQLKNHYNPKAIKRFEKNKVIPAGRIHAVSQRKNSVSDFFVFIPILPAAICCLFTV